MNHLDENIAEFISTFRGWTTTSWPISIDSRGATGVLRERSRKAREEIGVDQLLAGRKPRRHRVAELPSLADHRLVARKLDARMVDEERD